MYYLKNYFVFFLKRGNVIRSHSSIFCSQNQHNHIDEFFLSKKIFHFPCCYSRYNSNSWFLKRMRWITFKLNSAKQQKHCVNTSNLWMRIILVSLICPLEEMAKENAYFISKSVSCLFLFSSTISPSKNYSSPSSLLPIFLCLLHKKKNETKVLKEFLLFEFTYSFALLNVSFLMPFHLFIHHFNSLFPFSEDINRFFC